MFLHAASYTGKLWLPQTRALASEFGTLAPDLPGHGARAGEPFTLPAAVNAVRETLDREGIERAVLIGVSLGGCVSMMFASQFPERVAGMVLSGCTFNPCRPLAQCILTGEGVVFPIGAGCFTRGLHRWLAANLEHAMAEEMIAAGTYWQAAADAVRALRGVDFIKRLSAYPGPVLILNGERDWVHRSSEGAYARAAQNSRVEVLDGAGHVPNLDAPGAFTAAVRRFARGVARNCSSLPCGQGFP